MDQGEFTSHGSNRFMCILFSTGEGISGACQCGFSSFDLIFRLGC